jgi:DNA repair protein RadC
MAAAHSTAAARPLRSTPKKPQVHPAGIIEHLEPDVHRLVARALRALERSAIYRAAPLSSPASVRAYLELRLAPLDHEEFIALWLDAQNRLISADTLSTGTLSATQLYPREVVRSALRHNAAAVILAHNHPSGQVEPSTADEALTAGLKAALALVDVKVLDHFIVGGTAAPLSFAERGLL